MRTSSIRYVALAALAAFALAACSSSSKPASSNTSPTTTTVGETTTAAPATGGATTVSLASTKLGQVLVDSKGMTLYVDEKDKPGKPACTGSCLSAWPPLAAAGATYGTGLDSSKFTTVTASDGTKQLAVNGFPLYLWTNDKKPGDTTGQDVNGFYVVGKDYKKVEGSGS
jgi:predicted lipoprotein with Yx(FWY)xxD motif